MNDCFDAIPRKNPKTKHPFSIILDALLKISGLSRRYKHCFCFSEMCLSLILLEHPQLLKRLIWQLYWTYLYEKSEKIKHWILKDNYDEWQHYTWFAFSLVSSIYPLSSCCVFLFSLDFLEKQILFRLHAVWRG